MPEDLAPARRRAYCKGMQPPGLSYLPDFLPPEEEARLIAWMQTLEYGRFVMRGQASRREVLHYGYLYGYDSFQVTPGPPIPDPVLPLRERIAEVAGGAPEDWAEVLLTRYQPGATIGWHRDAPPFGPAVVGVSLGAPCELRFREGSAGRTSFAVTAEPRSLYVIAGPARTKWQHSIPAVKETRYSITFRTLRSRRAE